MGMFYRVSDKQLLKDRNDIFKEVGIPALERNGFIMSPFNGSWHGEYDKSIEGFIYEFSRLTGDNHLQRVDVYILNRERWIQIYLNVFELSPQLISIKALNKHDGVQFGLPPASKTKMRLRNDDYKGPPILYMLFLPEHKIRSYYTKFGYETEVKKLNKLIKSDMENIDYFVKRWHEIHHNPTKTTWEGTPI